MTKAFGVGVLSQFQDFSERCVDISRARTERRFIRDRRDLVPGTDVLANIAAVKPAFQFRGDLLIHFRRARFNRRVRNALSRIHYVWLYDSAGWTGIKTEGARTTLVGDFFVRVFKIQIQQQLADENPRAILARDQIRVLAHPTQPGANGPGLIHHWLDVDANFAGSLRPLFFNPGQELAQLIADDFMIVVTPGIARD